MNKERGQLQCKKELMGRKLKPEEAYSDRDHFSELKIAKQE